MRRALLLTDFTSDGQRSKSLWNPSLFKSFIKTIMLINALFCGVKEIVILKKEFKIPKLFAGLHWGNHSITLHTLELLP